MSGWAQRDAENAELEAGRLAAIADDYGRLEAENIRLKAELSAAIGYMLNAKIDLDTGAPKRTALATIEGGIQRARAALEPAP